MMVQQGMFTIHGSAKPLEPNVSRVAFSMIVDSIAVGILALPGIGCAVAVALWLDRKPPQPDDPSGADAK